MSLLSPRDRGLTPFQHDPSPEEPVSSSTHCPQHHWQLPPWSSRLGAVHPLPPSASSKPRAEAGWIPTQAIQPPGRLAPTTWLFRGDPLIAPSQKPQPETGGQHPVLEPLAVKQALQGLGWAGTAYQLSTALLSLPPHCTPHCLPPAWGHHGNGHRAPDMSLLTLELGPPAAGTPAPPGRQGPRDKEPEEGSGEKKREVPEREGGEEGEGMRGRGGNHEVTAQRPVGNTASRREETEGTGQREK